MDTIYDIKKTSNVEASEVHFSLQSKMNLNNLEKKLMITKTQTRAFILNRSFLIIFKNSNTLALAKPQPTKELSTRAIFACVVIP